MTIRLDLPFPDLCSHIDKTDIIDLVDQVQQGDIPKQLLTLFSSRIPTLDKSVSFVEKMIVVLPSPLMHSSEAKQLLDFLEAKGRFNEKDALANFLFNSAMTGNVPILSKAIECYDRLIGTRGAAVKIKINKGHTPLHWASSTPHQDTVILLIVEGADVNAKNNDLHTPLHVSCSRNRYEISSILLQNGALVNPQDNAFQTPLCYASKHDNINLILLLLAYGAEANPKKGKTPLHIAAAEGNYTKIISLLLDNGADIDGNLEYAAPLYCASYLGRTETVRMLLAKGANVHKKTANDRTPLHAASRNGHKEIVILLIENGGNVLNKSSDGLTPLHMACEEGHVDTALALIEYGASLFATDNQKRFPLDLASAEVRNKIGSQLPPVYQELKELCLLSDKPQEFEKKIKLWEGRGDFNQIALPAFSDPTFVELMIQYGVDKFNHYQIYDAVAELPVDKQHQFLFLCSPKRQLELVQILSEQEKTKILAGPILINNHPYTVLEALDWIQQRAITSVGTLQLGSPSTKTITNQMNIPLMFALVAQEERYQTILFPFLAKLDLRQSRILIPYLTPKIWLTQYRTAPELVKGQLLSFSFPSQSASLEDVDLLGPEYGGLPNRLKGIKEMMLTELSEISLGAISIKLGSILKTLGSIKTQLTEQFSFVINALGYPHSKEQKKYFEDLRAVKEKTIEDFFEQCHQLQTELHQRSKEMAVEIPSKYTDPSTFELLELDCVLDPTSEGKQICNRSTLQKNNWRSPLTNLPIPDHTDLKSPPSEFIQTLRTLRMAQMKGLSVLKQALKEIA